MKDCLLRKYLFLAIFCLPIFLAPIIFVQPAFAFDWGTYSCDNSVIKTCPGCHRTNNCKGVAGMSGSPGSCCDTSTHKCDNGAFACDPPPACPYTDIALWFLRINPPPGVEQTDADHLTTVVGQQVDVYAKGSRRDNGEWEVLDPSQVYIYYWQPAAAKEGFDPNFNVGHSIPFGQGGYTFDYGGTYQFSAKLTDGNCTTDPSFNTPDGSPANFYYNQLTDLTLTVLGCPYNTTSVQIADADNSPFSYFEENPDVSKGFCSYATAAGSCQAGTDTTTFTRINGQMFTHMRKNLRFKVVHRDDASGMVTDYAKDANVMVTDPTGANRLSTTTAGSGYANFFLNPDWTTENALIDGGKNKDLYEVFTTTNVTNPTTGEVVPVTSDASKPSYPLCTDTDNFYVDACPYDSTQAYVKVYNWQQWASKNEGQSYYRVNLNDKVQFSAWHNYPNPSQPQPPNPPTIESVSPLEKASIIPHIFGAYGLLESFDTATQPYIRKMDLPGAYQFEAETYIQRSGGGVQTSYPLFASPFCYAKMDLRVGPEACKLPPPPVDPVSCCPPKENPSSPWTAQLPSFGIPLAPLELKLGLTKFVTTVDTRKLADLVFGTNVEGVLNPGRFFAFLPPYDYLTNFHTNDDRVNAREAGLNWNIKLKGGTSPQPLTDGPIRDLEPLSDAVAKMQNWLVARPKADVEQPNVVAANEQNSTLALAPAQTDSPVNSDGAVLGLAAPVCTDVRPSLEIDNPCYTDTAGYPIQGTDLAALVGGLASGKWKDLLGINIDKLDWLGRYYAGIDTSGTTNQESALNRDQKYVDGGLDKMFRRPGEPAQADQAGKATATPVLGVKVFPFNLIDWLDGFRIEMPNADLSLRHFGAVEEVERRMESRVLRPGESLPVDGVSPTPTPTLTPTPTPTPTVTPIPPGNIPHTDTAVAITDSRKADIMTYVETRWPASPIRSQWDYVYDTGRGYGYNPAFIIALWMEESGASGYTPPFWDLGCGSGPQNNLPSQLNCMNGLSYKNTPWPEFSCRFADGHYPCTFEAHPNFIHNLTGFYQCVTQSSCSLF